MNDFSYLPDDIEITIDLIEPGIFAFDEMRQVVMNKTEFIHFIKSNNAAITGNGIVYQNNSTGLIPSILSDWFTERLSYKEKMKEYSYGSEKYQYYDRKQLITKILLNSFYGVLLLPSFRFYDKDNGEGVTLSGQDITKFSILTINNYYQKKLNNPTKEDYITCSDTDSVYVQATPLIVDLNQPDTVIYEQVVNISDEVCKYVNTALRWLTDRHFNSNNFKLKFAQEKISKRAFWGDAKKRYAQLTVNEKLDEKVEVKGMDMVRSSFPQAFRTFQKEVITDILHDIPYTDLNSKIYDFKQTYKKEPLNNIMLPTSVKEYSKYSYGQKGTPIHVKSAQNYNKLLDLFKIENLPKINDGDKILWAYLKQNPYGFDTIAIRGYEDPSEILEFVEKFVDKEEIFNRSLMSKLQDTWDNLGWGKIILEQNNDFF